MERCYEVLKEHFSHSHNTSSNPSQLVVFAEHATNHGRKNIASDCLQIYFSLNPPSNQFYVRALLCSALITAPSSADDEVGLAQALSKIVKAVNIAKMYECYHFLVYNASVLLWQICRPFQYQGARQLFAKPLQNVVRTLEVCKEKDYEWRLELLMGLIQSQMEAGYREDAVLTCASAVQLAKKNVPSKLQDVLKIQIYYNMGEVRKDTEMSSAVYHLCKTKGIIHQQEVTDLELEQKLRKVFSYITGVGGSSPVHPIPREVQAHVLLELGALSLECHLASLAKECAEIVSPADVSHDPRLLIIRESLVCQLRVQDLEQPEKAYSRSGIEVRLKALSKATHLLAVAKRTRLFDLIQYICVVLWNLSIPLLHQSLRTQLLKPMSDVANALDEINSVLLQLRANVHFELAKILIDLKNLQTALKHIEESLALDIYGEHSEHLQLLMKQVSLKADLYDIPDNPLDQATRLVEQASTHDTIEQLQSMLIKAGDLLVPDIFTSMLVRISPDKDIEQRLQNYIQYEQQVKDSMTDIGNKNDRERCWILSKMVKLAYKFEIWDVASVAAQLCLCHDDGRWKVIQKRESRSNTVLPDHLQCTNSADVNFALPRDGGGNDQTSEARSTIEILRRLAEIHCILAECLVHDLQQERAHSSLDTGNRGPSNSNHYRAYTEWTAVITDDVLKALVRAAELGSAVGETWLVYNSAASLWNYSHCLEINEKTLISACRQLLPLLKQVDLRSDSTMGILVCTALANGLVKKWTPSKAVSEKGTASVPISGKKNARQMSKKGTNRDTAAGDQLQVDPEGTLELKEALEVCEYAMSTYFETSMETYRRLLVVWVRCKQLLQQSLHSKALDIAEGMDAFKCRAVVEVEMLSITGNGMWDFPNCPSLNDVVVLLSECHWKDKLIEMELWTKLASSALRQKEYKLVQLCCNNTTKVSNRTPIELQKQKSSMETLLLSLASSLKGQSLSPTSNGNVASTRKSLETFLNGARYGSNAGSCKLLMDTCRHYWNTCLPLAPISVERDLLRTSMLELLGVVATFVDRRKEFTMDPSGNHDQDCNVILAMYGLVFQAFAEKHEWDKGLQALDDALWAMPKVISQHLFKYKLIFKSRMGKSVESDMTKFQDEPKEMLAALWYQAATNATDVMGGLKAYQNTMQLLQSQNHSWQKVKYLLEFSEWLHQHQYPPQNVLDHLQKVVDIILSTDFDKDDNVQNTDHAQLSALPNTMNVLQLEALIRVHVMMSMLHIKGSSGHRQCSIAALGFCFQMWKLTCETLNVDVKSSGPAVPTTIMEWASFQIPDQLINNMKTYSDTTSMNNCSIKKPMLTVHYLGILVRSLIENGMDALAIPVLQLQLAIAHSLISRGEPLCKLLHMRLAALCRKLGLVSAAAAHSEKINDVLIDPEDLERSRVEIEQNRAKTETVERLASKCNINNCQPAADITSVYSRTVTQTKLMANHLQTKCVHKSIIKGRVMLREIWMRQGLILISQGEYQDAHMLLNYSLESSQIFEDSDTLFHVYCGLAVLAMKEKEKHKFLEFVTGALKLSCELNHWLDGIIFLCDNLTTEEDHDQVSRVLECALSLINSMTEKLKNKTALQYSTAVLTSRLNLLKLKRSLSSSNGMSLGVQVAHYCKVVTESANTLLEQGCCRVSAYILGKQAKFYCISAKQNYLLDSEKCHEHLLKALKLYDESISLLYGVHESARSLCQPCEEITLPVQQELAHALLEYAGVLLMIFEEYSDTVVRAQITYHQKSTIEKVIDDYVAEIPTLSLTEEYWKATALFAIEKSLAVLSSAYFLAQGNVLLKAKCTMRVGQCYYLLTRHNSLNWGTQWRVISGKSKKMEAKVDLSTDDTEAEVSETKVQSPENNMRDSPKLTKIHREDDDRTKAIEQTVLQLLSQSCHSLVEALHLVLCRCDWKLNIGAFAALKVVDCFGVFDPSTSSVYLALYQSLVTSTRFKELLRKVHCVSSKTELGVLLQQNCELSQKNVCSAMEVNTTKLNTYEVYRRLQITENHLELITKFPAHFRIIVLQHSFDRSQLFSACLTPPQLMLPVTKKGQLPQQTEYCEPVISCGEVSSIEFNLLLKKLDNFHTSLMPLLEDRPVSLKEMVDDQFADILTAMEHYFEEPLRATVDSLRKQNADKDLSLVILADSDLLKLPLEAMKIFKQGNIASVSRDFSLQLLYHRILKLSHSDEEATYNKDKMKVDKLHPQPTTLLADVANFKYILGPRHSLKMYPGSLDIINNLISFISSNKLTSKWSGYCLPENIVSLSEWSTLLKDASGLLFVGNERILAHCPPSHLTTMNLQQCHVILLMEHVQGASREQSRKFFSHDIKIEHNFAEAVPSTILLSLVGAGCIVAIQSVMLTSVIEALVVEGTTTGGANWSKMKTSQARAMETIKDDYQGMHSSSSDIPNVTKDNHNKQPPGNIYNGVVYGLPHITLV